MLLLIFQYENKSKRIELQFFVLQEIGLMIILMGIDNIINNLCQPV
jgi:hypothetical protein